jgi:hypothetical protein
MPANAHATRAGCHPSGITRASQPPGPLGGRGILGENPRGGLCLLPEERQGTRFRDPRKDATQWT